MVDLLSPVLSEASEAVEEEIFIALALFLLNKAVSSFERPSGLYSLSSVLLVFTNRVLPYIGVISACKRVLFSVLIVIGEKLLVLQLAISKASLLPASSRIMKKDFSHTCVMPNWPRSLLF